MNRVFSVLAALALGLTACGAGPTTSDKAFGEKVRAYLLEHPEVIREAVQKLQENEQAESMRQMSAAIEPNRNAIERDPRDLVVNPNGKLTVTEFYDYGCPYCKLVSADYLTLMKSSPDVRFVFKEMPIVQLHGQVAVRASRAALAIHKAGKDGVAAYSAMMAAKPISDGVIDDQLAKAGLPATAANGSDKAIEDQLADVQRLAAKLHIEGTPTFVVGDSVIPGADLDALKSAIAEAKAKKG